MSQINLEESSIYFTDTLMKERIDLNKFFHQSAQIDNRVDLYPNGNIVLISSRDNKPIFMQATLATFEDTASVDSYSYIDAVGYKRWSKTAGLFMESFGKINPLYLYDFNRGRKVFRNLFSITEFRTIKEKLIGADTTIKIENPYDDEETATVSFILTDNYDIYGDIVVTYKNGKTKIFSQNTSIEIIINEVYNDFGENGYNMKVSNNQGQSNN